MTDGTNEADAMYARHSRKDVSNMSFCSDCSWVSAGYYVNWPCDARRAATVLRAQQAQILDLMTFVDELKSTKSDTLMTLPLFGALLEGRLISVLRKAEEE